MTAESSGLETSEELRAVLERDVVEGAIRLLGCTLVHPGGKARIVETEAYRGSDDPGCHAYGRVQMKNMALFGPPGRAYVYRSYGIHQMLNVVALPAGAAGGILIRALKSLDKTSNPRDVASSDQMNGPGKLARVLGVDASLNGIDLLDGEGSISIEPEAPLLDVLYGPRIGLALGKGETTLWRFVAAQDLPWASATRRALLPMRSPYA